MLGFLVDGGVEVFLKEVEAVCVGGTPLFSVEDKRRDVDCELMSDDEI